MFGPEITTWSRNHLVPNSLGPEFTWWWVTNCKHSRSSDCNRSLGSDMRITNKIDKLKCLVDKIQFVPKNLILLHRIGFCYTELDFVTRIWVLWNKIEFCYTELIFVTQISILLHRIEFCDTKFNFLHRIDFCGPELNFVTQKSILWHKIQFCDKNWILLQIIEFCETNINRDFYFDVYTILNRI